VDRHAAPTGSKLAFGCLNIRSVSNKLDDLLNVCHDSAIDVLLLVETWHDADSVSFRRLRADGFQVVDRPRPRLRADTTSTNHGGVAVVAVNGVRLSSLDIGVKPESFELLCVRVTSGSSSCIAILIYRPGSAVITQVFFNELSDVLDRVATLREPIVMSGDLNIRLDRADVSASRQFHDILAVRGIGCRVTNSTHDQGGILDIVAT